MNLSLSEEQEMLRKAAREFLDTECPKSYVREMEEDQHGFRPEIWKKIASLGWLGLPFPAEYGGGGGTFLDLAVLLEEMGRALLPGPFFCDVVLGGLALNEAGSPAQKQTYLPRLCRGESIFTLAVTEPSASYDPADIRARAVLRGEDFVINGVKLFVPYAHVADYCVTAARTGRGREDITLFVVPGRSAGVSTTVLKSIASDKLCEVAFENVKVPREAVLGKMDDGWGTIQSVLLRAAAASCCEAVGGAQKVKEMTVGYAKERVQFDHPIGSFQAIQQYCADMATDVDAMRFTSYQAASLLSEGAPCARQVSIAKAFGGEAYRRVCALGHQIHAGVGFTKAHDMQLYFRHSKAAEVTYGDPDFHREIIASELGL